MAKNVLPKYWNGSEFEELHIVTKASNVLTKDNESVQQKMDDFTAHLAEIVKQGITCAQLNMVANDASKGLDNFIKLVTAINQNKKILVDDVYYLETNGTVDINKNIHLIGIGNDSKFFVKNGTYFKLVDGCKKLSIIDVSFENTGPSLALLFTIRDSIKIDHINVSNNFFIGNISLMRWIGPINVNPEVVNWGIGQFNFIKNQVKNTRYSFITLNDVPFDVYNVEANRVNNFDYVFFSCSISNNHVFPKQIFKAMKTLNVRDNEVVCDDAWWGSGDNGSYYAFVVAETQKAIYERNTVEGIKSDYLIALYDSYLSCAYVEYKNNTWKNNICFNVNKVNNTLMKAKGNGGERYYENNKFIIEEGFATKFGKDKNLLRVDFYSCTSDVKRWSIKNNIIDVYSLNYPVASQSIDEQWIENNTIKTFVSKGNILFYRSVADKNYVGVVHRLVNNTIINYGDYNGTDGFHLAKSVDYSDLANLVPDVIISNNNVIATNLGYLFYDVFAKKLTVEKNRIEVPYSVENRLGGYGNVGHVEDLQVADNIFTKSHGKVFENRMYIVGKVEEDYLIKEFTGTNSNSGFFVKVGNNTPIKHRYVREYEILSSAGYSKFSYTFDYFYDEIEGKNKITFVNSSDIADTLICGEGAGHNTNIKLNGVVAGTLSVKLFNNNGLCYFYLNGLADGYKTIKVKTYTAIV